MPAAPAPPPLGARRPRVHAAAAWPVTILFTLAALSWGAIATLQVAAPPRATHDVAHLVSSSSSDAPREAVVPGVRLTFASVLRLAVDALLDGPAALALAAFGGVVIVLAAVALLRDARQRWWARLVGAPPVLDVHLV